MGGPLSIRDHVIEEYTRTVCPHCFAERSRRSDEAGVFVDGQLISRAGKVWMRRWCASHGVSESLYEEDLTLWRERAGWSTPTSSIIPDRADNFAGFPDGYREGLPASHGQHSCILLLNVTERCNYACPTCYASALAPGTRIEGAELPTWEQMRHTVQTVIDREGGRLGVLMLSGGEPTIRKDLPEIIDALDGMSITRIMLNTNGRRIARDDEFLARLQRHSRRLEVYLQFDGVNEAPYEKLRGEAVFEEKQRTLERLNQAGIFTTLVMTIQKGVNDDQIGAVMELAMKTPKCSGIAFQPVFGSGRNAGFDPMDRVTPTGVQRRIEAQTKGKIRASDFIPLPCSHRDCCDIGYFVRDNRDEWRSIVEMVGRDRLKEWIHLAANSITFENTGGMVREMLQGGTLQRIFSEQNKPSGLALAKDLFAMCGCVPGVTELLLGFQKKEEKLEKLSERTLRVVIKQFMDAHTFHEARIRQCCVHTGTFEDDPRRHSFCWRWLFDDATDFPGGRTSTLPMAP